MMGRECKDSDRERIALERNPSEALIWGGGSIWGIVNQNVLRDISVILILSLAL